MRFPSGSEYSGSGRFFIKSSYLVENKSRCYEGRGESQQFSADGGRCVMEP